MPVYVNTFFETRLKSLFDLAAVVDEAFSAAGIDYRVAGGLATYLYVEEALTDAGRLTRDIDIVVRRQDLKRIAVAVTPYCLKYAHASGEDKLVQAESPARRAVHLLFAGERVKADSLAPTPELGAGRTINGIRLISLEDLIRMKLTSFRLKDQTHLKDLQEAGLLTMEIERALPSELSERLQQVLQRE